MVDTSGKLISSFVVFDFPAVILNARSRETLERFNREIAGEASFMFSGCGRAERRGGCGVL